VRASDIRRDVRHRPPDLVRLAALVIAAAGFAVAALVFVLSRAPADAASRARSEASARVSESS
jgi:hypothetical protein